jgi:hypothetical protein
VPSAGYRAGRARRQPGDVIRATLTGSAVATAGVVSVTANAPLLMLARVLLANGFDPETRLEAWRGATLALIVSPTCIVAGGSG